MTEMKESHTALGVAWMRALHQVLDSKPLVLEDGPIDGEQSDGTLPVARLATASLARGAEVALH